MTTCMHDMLSRVVFQIDCIAFLYKRPMDILHKDYYSLTATKQWHERIFVSRVRRASFSLIDEIRISCRYSLTSQSVYLDIRWWCYEKNNRQSEEIGNVNRERFFYLNAMYDIACCPHSLFLYVDGGRKSLEEKEIHYRQRKAMNVLFRAERYLVI